MSGGPRTGTRRIGASSSSSAGTRVRAVRGKRWSRCLPRGVTDDDGLEVVGVADDYGVEVALWLDAVPPGHLRVGGIHGIKLVDVVPAVPELEEPVAVALVALDVAEVGTGVLRDLGQREQVAGPVV